MISIWHIEDDDQNAAFWAEEAEAELRTRWRSFASLMSVCNSTGNPDYLIFDVGSVGLMQSEATYLSAFRRLRDKFPNTPVFLVSGLDFLPAMIREEFPEEELIYPITGYDHLTQVFDRIKELEPEACKSQ